MGLLVDRVRVSNFRALRNVEVTLSPVTVLVGMNNSGKTSFLKALQLALGADRRVLSADDFHIVGATGHADQPEHTIVIDLRIIPTGPERSGWATTLQKSPIGGPRPRSPAFPKHLDWGPMA